MNMKDQSDELLHKEITDQILKAFYKVYNSKFITVSTWSESILLIWWWKTRASLS